MRSIRRAVGLGVVVAVAGLGSTLASPASAATLNCGQVLTKSTTLTADVGPCPRHGLIVRADNVVVDLNGHRVFGTPGPGNARAVGI